MVIFALIVLTVIVLCLFGAWFLWLSRQVDDRVGEGGMTKNQLRMIAYLLVVVLALIGAIIEWKVVVEK